MIPALILLLAAQSPLPSARSGEGPFLIYFECERADITNDQQPVLINLVQAIQARPSARVEIVGHADRNGPVDYNMTISRQRAETVRQALVSRGVSARAISVNAAGEQGILLVPTKDGTSERRNRFVSVVLR